jgi:ABC-type transport system involved in cytochrome c biogenesis ATPase subunit
LNPTLPPRRTLLLLIRSGGRHRGKVYEGLARKKPDTPRLGDFLFWSPYQHESEYSIKSSDNSPLMVMQVQGLQFQYPQRLLFDNWSACIPPGITLLRGGEDSGKTTLLRLLAGDMPATAGHLQVNAVQLDKQAMAYRQQIFWIDPRSTAFDQMTPTAFFDAMSDHFPGFDQGLLAELIEGLSLAPHMKKCLYMLSTGSKRKVWLAAAFSAEAVVTLLDDPFASLDRVSINFVLRTLRCVSNHATRAWIVAGYEAPQDVALASVIDLAG